MPLQTRIAVIKKADNYKCLQGWRETGTLIHCWLDCKMMQLLCKTVQLLLKKLNIGLPYGPTVPSPSIHPRELKVYVYVHTKTCAQMLTEALFIRAKSGNNSDFHVLVNG